MYTLYNDPPPTAPPVFAVYRLIYDAGGTNLDDPHAETGLLGQLLPRTAMVLLYTLYIVKSYVQIVNMVNLGVYIVHNKIWV
jgi:hypothetical protein